MLDTMVDKNTIPSFIPKEEEAKKVRNHIERIRNYLNAFVFIGAIVFALSVGGAVLSYLFVGYTTTELAQMQTRLNQATQGADEATISELNRFDTRLRVASDLLQNHKIMTPVLAEIEDYTIQAVQLSSASIDFNSAGLLSVSGTGESLNYQALATQSDSFSDSPRMTNPIFSSFQENQDNLVTFDYTFELDPSLVNAFNNSPISQEDKENDLVSFVGNSNIKNYE